MKRKYIIEIEAPEDKDTCDVEFELNELLDYADSTIRIIQVEEAE